MKAKTNTERLISELKVSERAGHDSLSFMVGKYAGYGPSVVQALRRRGYIVHPNRSGYTLSRAPAIRSEGPRV